MMNQIAVIGMVVAMLGVIAVLGKGLVVMVRGKDVSGAQTNKLMWWRVYLQAIALGFFALILFLVKK
jgi:quinol-cytochrome oxidoreductase complex cytochrome b subunit